MYFSKRLLSFIFLWKDGGRLLFSFLDYSNLSFNGDIKCSNSVILGGKYPNQKQYITALFSFFLLFLSVEKSKANCRSCCSFHVASSSFSAV